MIRYYILVAITILLWNFSLQAQFLKVSDNNRYLVEEDGTPFFWLGDTGWEMLHRLDRKEMERYMKNRSGKAFTVIQTVIVSEINGLTFPNMEGNLPFEEFDPERPNEEYFKLVDFAVQMAEDLDLVLALLPTWGNYLLPGSHPLMNEAAVFNPGNAYSYGKFLGERYEDAPNILWVLGGDQPAGPQIEIWEAMAKGLEDGEEGAHLMTYHPRGQQTSSTWFHKSEWLDFNMLQTGHFTPSFNVYDWITNDYFLDPVKPVVNGEPAYEDMSIWFNPSNPRHDDYEIRKQAYWSVFAGAFGHTYGNNNIWQMHRDSVDQESRIWPNMSWDKALNQPGSGQLVHLRSLIESRPFLTRIPDQAILIGENPSMASDHIRITRDGTPGEKDASYIMAYLPYYRGFFQINTEIIVADHLNVWLYDPVTGKAFLKSTIKNSGQFSLSNWEVVKREPGSGPDWVVVIDDASRNYGAPGQ